MTKVSHAVQLVCIHIFIFAGNIGSLFFPQQKKIDLSRRSMASVRLSLFLLLVEPPVSSAHHRVDSFQLYDRQSAGRI
jgi:hypothetical protein